MELSNRVKCGITGALAGAANGVFGAGGGMLIIPLLTRWAGLSDRKAFASSVCIVLPMCAASSIIYFTRTELKIAEALPYLIGGFFGGVIGGLLYKKIPVKYLRKALGLLIIYGGVKSLI